MICKNPHCRGTIFIAVIEMDTNRVIGLKCFDCQARYSIEDIEIKRSLKRIGWNSAQWTTTQI